MRHYVILLGALLLNFCFAWGQFNEDAVLNIPNDDKLPLNWGYFPSHFPYLLTFPLLRPIYPIPHHIFPIFP